MRNIIRTFLISKETSNQLDKLAVKHTEGNFSALMRQYIEKGMKAEAYNDDEGHILNNMKSALNEVLMPQVNRLASIEAKGAVSSTYAFLVALVFIQLLVDEKSRPDTEHIIDITRKYAINFIKCDKGSIDEILKSSVKAILSNIVN